MQTVPDLDPGDLRLFEAGRNSNLHLILGAHPDDKGTFFRVWAPSARSVHVVGDFEAGGWGAAGHQLRLGNGGIWSGFVPGAWPGQLYKFRLVDSAGRLLPDKADPFAAAAEASPGTASLIADLGYEWHDGKWMAQRTLRQALDAPVSIYELHLGSWDEAVDYRGLAEPLAEHVLSLGFTHVELLPVTEHPFYGSWGYQATGYFAPTARYGAPQDLMYLIDELHQRGVGVILDWTPAHFANDDHALARFDGAPLFEHADPRRAWHPEWGTLIFNYERPEVRSFLLSSACSWLERYHADGLRVDAVSSMLYRDFLRKDRDWVPNEQGGPEDYGAVALLRDLNDAAHTRFPGVQTYAEEPRGWPGATRSIDEGGLGFDFKWDIGWAHDTLSYLGRDPSERPEHHQELTFRESYASKERFVLPLSHDVVANDRGSLLQELPGSRDERFSALRALLGYQFATPGRKLLFMGTELAPWSKWDHNRPLDWSLATDDDHSKMARWLGALNRLYVGAAALHAHDYTPDALRWVVVDDAEHATLALLRGPVDAAVLVVVNFSATLLEDYRIRVPSDGLWRVLLDSDAVEFGGSGRGPRSPITTTGEPRHGHADSLSLRLPPLTVLFLAAERPGSK